MENRDAQEATVKKIFEANGLEFTMLDNHDTVVNFFEATWRPYWTAQIKAKESGNIIPLVATPPLTEDDGILRRNLADAIVASLQDFNKLFKINDKKSRDARVIVSSLEADVERCVAASIELRTLDSDDETEPLIEAFKELPQEAQERLYFVLGLKLRRRWGVQNFGKSREHHAFLLGFPLATKTLTKEIENG